MLDRSSVPSDPEKNMKAAEDFLLVVLHAHAVCAAKMICSLLDVQSIMELSKVIVANHTLMQQFCTDMSDSKTVPTEGAQGKASDKTGSKCSDQVNLYAMEVLTLGLLWHGFHDASREGDGERILRYWKVLLVLFKSSRNYNYAKDAVNLILSHKYLLSERKAAQLLWSRTVNTRGREGCNIPMDLHMEHLNRTLKSILSNVGANITAKNVVKAGKSLRAVHKVCAAFQMDTAKSSISAKHPYPAFNKDLQKVLAILEEVEVFVPMEKREHSCFAWKKGLLQTFSKDKLAELTKNNVKQLLGL